MADRKLVEGKVYFRDVRNGAVYDYESHLSNIPHMKRFVHKAEAKAKPVAQNEKDQGEQAKGGTGEQKPAQQTPPAQKPAEPAKQTAQPEK